MRVSPVWFFASLIMAGCARQPASPALVPLPPQRQLVPAIDLPYERDFLFMSEARASARIVRDIAGEGIERWTGPHPAMRFPIAEPGPYLAEIRFRASQNTLKDTGPITLTLLLDGRPLASLRVSGDNAQTLSAPVSISQPSTELSFTIDKPWVSPADGARLGVLLKAMGFRRPPALGRP